MELHGVLLTEASFQLLLLSLFLHEEPCSIIRVSLTVIIPNQDTVLTYNNLNRHLCIISLELALLLISHPFKLFNVASSVYIWYLCIISLACSTSTYYLHIHSHYSMLGLIGILCTSTQSDSDLDYPPFAGN